MPIKATWQNNSDSDSDYAQMVFFGGGRAEFRFAQRVLGDTIMLWR